MWLGGNSVFEAGGVVCYVVTHARLWTINTVTLGCPWCVFEVVGGSTSWMSVLSWWGRFFEVCVSGW